MTYCFRCRTCGARYEGRTPGTAGELDAACRYCAGPIVRDYRAEAVGIGSGVRVSRDQFGGLEARAAAFLPTPDDFKGPGDPDGMKGLRSWRDEHEPTKGDVIGNMLPKTQF